MLIAEIFESIQGEGRLSGVPSVFVRTAGCNLRCNWCDTPYASWAPEGEDLSVAEVVDRVRGLSSAHCVLTGGEPMVAPAIHELAQALREIGKHLTIETAGTVSPAGIACDLASLSPKLSNSTPDDRVSPAWRARHEERRLQPDVVREWIDGYDVQLKFVVRGEPDLAEIREFLDGIGREVEPEKVLLMPEGTEPEVLQRRGREVTKMCTRYGYRFSPRLHIELFGNTRGT
jgi:7-carboxy-7-deazaguanine synthase